METTNIFVLIGIIFTLIFFGFLLILFIKSALVKDNLKLSRRNMFLEDYIDTLYQKLDELDNKFYYISDSQVYERDDFHDSNNN